MQFIIVHVLPVVQEQATGAAEGLLLFVYIIKVAPQHIHEVGIFVIVPVRTGSMVVILRQPDALGDYLGLPGTVVLAGFEYLHGRSILPLN